LVEAAEPGSYLVTTTGKASRELFEIRERRGEGHGRDFLTVGSMGHASSIAMGICRGTDRLVYCVDGDGALLMHMGAAAICAQSAPANLRYVVINNGAHESVGGQPTVGFAIDVAGVLASVGFNVETVSAADDLAPALSRLSRTPHSALIVEVAQGSRDDLGRPTISPRENKQCLMRTLAADMVP
jgi:phosphonopyruvate decarboxylase